MSLRDQRNTQTLLYVVLAVLIFLIIAGTVTAVLILNRLNQADMTDDTSFLTKPPDLALTDDFSPDVPTFTALPTSTTPPTYTPEPTYTPQPTYTPFDTETPQPTRTVYVTPTFLYNVDEVLYLDSSIADGDFWNPDKGTPVVPEDDRIAILKLVKDAQSYREYVWRNEDYADLDDYNDGYGLTQMVNYYDYYIDPDDGCYVEIEIVDNQFSTEIIYYDNNIAKTMTMKVESRNRICGGVSEQWVPNDGYAYELKLQKLSDGMGGYAWKIIEHPLGGDPSQ